MVFTCCVPQCCTGCKPREGEQVSSENVPLFWFPRNEVLQRKWLRAIPREGLCSTEFLRICAKHFYEEDIMSTSSDCYENRRAARVQQELKSPRVKPQAIPRIFPWLPHYLTKPPASKLKRKGTASSSLRLTFENQRISEANLLFWRKI